MAGALNSPPQGQNKLALPTLSYIGSPSRQLKNMFFRSYCPVLAWLAWLSQVSQLLFSIEELAKPSGWEVNHERDSVGLQSKAFRLNTKKCYPSLQGWAATGERWRDFSFRSRFSSLSTLIQCHQGWNLFPDTL